MCSHPGHQEANAAVSLLEAQVTAQRGQRGGRIQLLPVALHAGMSAASQAAALQPTPRTHRKASLARVLSMMHKSTAV
jgi:HrpA-like RNA helicase